MAAQYTRREQKKRYRASKTSRGHRPRTPMLKKGRPEGRPRFRNLFSLRRIVSATPARRLAGILARAVRNGLSRHKSILSKFSPVLSCPETWECQSPVHKNFMEQATGWSEACYCACASERLGATHLQMGRTGSARDRVPRILLYLKHAATSFLNASARWLMECFASGSISAKVRAWPKGTKMGS